MMNRVIKWVTFPLSFLVMYYARNILFILIYALFTWLQTFSMFWLIIFLIVIGIALLYYGWIALLIVLGGLGQLFAKWMPNKFMFYFVVTVQFVSYLLMYITRYSFPKIMQREDISVALGIPMWIDVLISVAFIGIIAFGGISEYKKITVSNESLE